MNQEERCVWLIKKLLAEQPQYLGMPIPQTKEEQRILLRALLNVRPPKEASEEFLTIQDDYLSEIAREKGIIDINTLEPTKEDSRLILWQGDITRLKAGAIVNAANSAMTGCYRPNHSCIDNCIHTFSGVQLRLACQRLMDKQGHEEGTGLAKITPSFNLPSTYILHTVGPIVNGLLTDKHKALLASCYNSCLSLASEYKVESIAFCCISTGVFGFPQKEAAKIAVHTVKNYLAEHKQIRKVVFNVFQSSDYTIYRELLGTD